LTSAVYFKRYILFCLLLTFFWVTSITIFRLQISWNLFCYYLFNFFLFFCSHLPSWWNKDYIYNKCVENSTKFHIDNIKCEKPSMLIDVPPLSLYSFTLKFINNLLMPKASLEFINTRSPVCVHALCSNLSINLDFHPPLSRNVTKSQRH